MCSNIFSDRQVEKPPNKTDRARVTDCMVAWTKLSATSV